MYTSPSAMEPLLPASAAKLDDLSLALLKQAATLDNCLHPISAASVAELLRYANTYYSNLIENHVTHPIDIERAMRTDYSSEPAKRALQQEARAHVNAQQLIESRLNEAPETNITAPDFICWIHKIFYEQLPDDFTVMQYSDEQAPLYIEPGIFRKKDVQVGSHIAPAYQHLPAFMMRFAKFYDLKQLPRQHLVIACAAAHHRLAWIHPFLDGNGRVIRLFSTAWLRQIELSTHGLWSVSRGLARRRQDYLAALSQADRTRESDLDGRGNLSNKGLTQFCEFFLEACLDQVNFMQALLNLEDLAKRIKAYVALRHHGAIPDAAPLREEAAYVLCEALYHGEVARGDVPRITGLKERTARSLVSTLIKEELLQSTSSRAPLRLKITATVGAYYFPRLYPDIS